MELKTEAQVKSIVRTFKLIFETGEIGHLGNAGYKFIYLCSGFIAHYDIWGFKHEYKNVWSLAHDIRVNSEMNQWNNFSPSDRDYEYYMQKKDIYNKVLAIVNSYTQVT